MFQYSEIRKDALRRLMIARLQSAASGHEAAPFGDCAGNDARRSIRPRLECLRRFPVRDYDKGTRWKRTGHGVAPLLDDLGYGYIYIILIYPSFCVEILMEIIEIRNNCYKMKGPRRGPLVQSFFQ